MDRCPPGQQPRCTNVPDRGQFSASQSQPSWGFLTPDEGQTRPSRRHYREGTKAGAIIFNPVETKKVEYDNRTWPAGDAQRKKRFKQKLKRQARQLGYELVLVQAARVP